MSFISPWTKKKCYKITSIYPKIKLKQKATTIILKKQKVNVNVSKKIRKLQTTYDRDNTKQAEMPHLHCGPSRQEKILIRLDQNGEKNYIKK